MGLYIDRNLYRMFFYFRHIHVTIFAGWNEWRRDKAIPACVWLVIVRLPLFEHVPRPIACFPDFVGIIFGARLSAQILSH
jgi:hypothetical protein